MRPGVEVCVCRGCRRCLERTRPSRHVPTCAFICQDASQTTFQNFKSTHAPRPIACACIRIATHVLRHAMEAKRGSTTALHSSRKTLVHRNTHTHTHTHVMFCLVHGQIRVDGRTVAIQGRIPYTITGNTMRVQFRHSGYPFLRVAFVLHPCDIGRSVSQGTPRLAAPILACLSDDPSLGSYDARVCQLDQSIVVATACMRAFIRCYIPLPQWEQMMHHAVRVHADEVAEARIRRRYTLPLFHVPDTTHTPRQ
jgi:hypothetical protein